MKLYTFIALLLVPIAHAAKGGGWFWPPAKSSTLSELSTTPGVQVKIETISKDVYFDLPDINFSASQPNKRITILIFPDSTLFSPSFFKDYGPYIDPEHHSVFTSNLKAYLVVAGADKAVLSTAPLLFNGGMADDTGKRHIEITFCIAADLMANSYLMLNEEFPRSGGQMIPVCFGSYPDGWLWR